MSVRRRATALLAVTALALGACSDGGDDTADEGDDVEQPDGGTGDAGGGEGDEPTYRVQLRRTSDGVAHVTADDYGSLGYGQGYALAEDRACTLLDQVVKVRGERASYFGAGDDDEHLVSDLAYRHLGLHEEADERWADQPPEITELVEGYVAGFNAQVAEVGADGVVGFCTGEPWIQEITTTDLYAVVADVLLLASSRNLVDEIGRAQPPGAEGDAPADEPADDAPTTTAGEPATTTTDAAEGALAPAELDLELDAGASNGWAFGADVTASGGGALLANPHFPWEGEQRFWETHLTMPGELDVYGVALGGLPGVQIGFNDAIAWTHTVSSGNRFTLYRYALDPADPTRYTYGDEVRDMVATDIAVEVLGDDGETTTESRTMYATHHGPVLALDPIGWSADTAIAIRDGNIEITRVLEQFLGMDTATSMDEFQAVHAEFQGVPWVNTIATSADGRAWYADTSATPNLSQETIDAWLAERAAGGFAAVAYDQAGVVLLDGSNPANEWVDDPAAPAPGLLPYDALPQLERADVVFNANDSHWFVHPTVRLEGFSPLTGEEATPQSPRTRMNALLVSTPGPWDAEAVQAALLSERSLHAELLREPLVAACQATPTTTVEGESVDLAEACAVLDAWDGTFTVDAEGAALWREMLGSLPFDQLVDAGSLYATPFDPADPVGTPNALAADTAPALQALGAAVLALTENGVALDVPLGEVQFEVRSGDGLPIPGGFGELEGIANAVGCCGRGTTVETLPDVGDGIDGTELSAVDGLVGYPVSRGASFVMALEFGPDGPVAQGVLTYGNVDDPSDPEYRADLDRFSTGEWRPLLFTDDAIDADEDLEVLELEG